MKKATKKEAVRCLKRYIAREVYNHLPIEDLALDNHRGASFGDAPACRCGVFSTARGGVGLHHRAYRRVNVM